MNEFFRVNKFILGRNVYHKVVLLTEVPPCIYMCYISDTTSSPSTLSKPKRRIISSIIGLSNVYRTTLLQFHLRADGVLNSHPCFTQTRDEGALSHNRHPLQENITTTKSHSVPSTLLITLAVSQCPSFPSTTRLWHCKVQQLSVIE